MATAAGSRTMAQKFAAAFGAVYLVVGIAGLFVAEEIIGGSPDDKLILFPINHLHNAVHAAIGVIWLAASKTHVTAKAVNLIIGLTYVVVAAVGFTGVDFMHTLLNIHAPDSADNFLHLVSGLAGVYFGSAGASMAPTSARTS